MTMTLGIGAPELLILVIFFLLVVPFGVYWLIRLAVRHGSTDAQRKSGEGPPRPTA
jgi:hypothetical protein